MGKFLTDIGDSHIARSEVTGETFDFGRYAVWGPDESRRRHRVLKTSNDLDELAKEFGLDPATVRSISGTAANKQR